MGGRRRSSAPIYRLLRCNDAKKDFHGQPWRCDPQTLKTTFWMIWSTGDATGYDSSACRVRLTSAQSSLSRARRWRWLRFWNSGWQRGWQTPAFGRMMRFIICFNLPFCPLVCLVNTHGALYYHVQPRKQSLRLLDPHAQDLAAGYKHRSILSQRSSFTSPYRYRLTVRILKHTTSPICIP
jgi:hypothetical protein